MAFNFIQKLNWVWQDTINLFCDGIRNDIPEVPVHIRFLRRPNTDAEAVDDVIFRTINPGVIPSSYDVISKKCKCQIFRSLGKWSASTPMAEILHYKT